MHLPNEMHHWNSKRRSFERVGLISDSFSEALLVARHVWLDLELQDLGQGLNSLLKEEKKLRYARLKTTRASVRSFIKKAELRFTQMGTGSQSAQGQSLGVWGFTAPRLVIRSQSPENEGKD
jgi:hypothetical protein